MSARWSPPSLPELAPYGCDRNAITGVEWLLYEWINETELVTGDAPAEDPRVDVAHATDDTRGHHLIRTLVS